jgi:hypothetical protein
VLLDVGLAEAGLVCAPGASDFGAAPLDSPLVLELLEVLVVDFPQSHESDFELSLLLSSVLSHPDSELPDDVDEELPLDELDDELLELLVLLEELPLDELPLDELEELEELDEELDVPVLLLPQLSPLVSAVCPPVSLPVVDVLPQPSSATVLSSPVSS